MGYPDILQSVLLQIWDNRFLKWSGFDSKTRKLCTFPDWHSLFYILGKLAKKMITLQDFQLGSFEQKCDVVTSNSEYLSTRILGECKVYLYHTELFFIEVYYAPKHKKVLMIHAFNEVEGLMPYAEMVSLADLNL